MGKASACGVKGPWFESHAKRFFKMKNVVIPNWLSLKSEIQPLKPPQDFKNLRPVTGFKVLPSQKRYSHFWKVVPSEKSIITSGSASRFSWSLRRESKLATFYFLGFPLLLIDNNNKTYRIKAYEEQVVTLVSHQPTA